MGFYNIYVCFGRMHRLAFVQEGKITMEKKSNSRLFVVALIILAVSFLYYGGSAFMDGEMITENTMLHGNYWRWVPSIITLAIGVLIGWLLFWRKV
jgi:hypothetical protein